MAIAKLWWLMHWNIHIWPKLHWNSYQSLPCSKHIACYTPPEWKRIQIQLFTCLLYYIQRKIFFRWSFFLYSLCPKDALFHKFRRPTISYNCSAVCTNKGGHRDAFSNEWCEAPRVSRSLLSMQATCHRASSEARRGLFFVMPLWW